MNATQKKVRDSWHQMSKARSALEAKAPASGSPITPVSRAMSLIRKPCPYANKPYCGESVSLCAACFSTAGRVNGRLK